MHDHENTGSQKPRPSLQCQVAVSSTFQKSTPTSAAPPPTRRSSSSAWMYGPGSQYPAVPQRSSQLSG